MAVSSCFFIFSNFWLKIYHVVKFFVEEESECYENAVS